MIFLILLFLILGLTFLLRGTYRLLVPSGLALSGDAVVHLIIVDGIRTNGHRIPDRFPDLLLSGPHNYPSFFHCLLSFLPKKTLEHLEPFMGTLMEMIHNAFIFLAVYYLSLKQGLTNAIWVGFFASLIFALTPLLVDHVGRVFLLSERPFGSLLGTVFVFFALQYLVSSDLRFFIGASVTVGIIFISSKFTTQAVLFVSLIFSLLSWTTKLWLPIGSGLLFIAFISRGYVFRVLAGHLRHSIFYKTYLLRNYLRPTSQYLGLMKSLIKGIRNPFSLLQAFRTNSLLKLFSMLPWSMILFVLVWKGKEVLKADPLFQSFLLWSISCVIVLCITSLTAMRFLGEPERYLEASMLPVAFLTSLLLFESGSKVLWASFIATMIYALIVFGFIFSGVHRNRLWDSDQEELCEWLRKIRTSRILTIPLKAVGFFVYRTHHKGLSILTNISDPSQQQRFKELCPVLYPFPSPDFEKLARKYDLDLIIVDKSTLETLSRSGLGITYDFSRFQRRYENPSFIVYDLGGDS